MTSTAKNADEMYSPVLAQRVRELKETQKGVDHMSEVLDNLFEKMYSERLKLAEQRGNIPGDRAGDLSWGWSKVWSKARLTPKKETALSLGQYRTIYTANTQRARLSVPSAELSATHFCLVAVDYGCRLDFSCRIRNF